MRLKNFSDSPLVMPNPPMRVQCLCCKEKNLVENMMLCRHPNHPPESKRGPFCIGHCMRKHCTQDRWVYFEAGFSGMQWVNARCCGHSLDQRQRDWRMTSPFPRLSELASHPVTLSDFLSDGRLPQAGRESQQTYVESLQIE